LIFLIAAHRVQSTTWLTASQTAAAPNSSVPQPLVVLPRRLDEMAKARRKHHHADVHALVEQDTSKGDRADGCEMLTGAEGIIDRRRITDHVRRELVDREDHRRQLVRLMVSASSRRETSSY